MKTENIALDKIEQNENTRMTYKDSEIAELMGSMKDHQLLQPIGVKKLSGGKYEAVYGNRRIVAAKGLGWSHIPAVIVQVDTDSERDILNLVENMKRKDVTVAEEGRMFCSLRERGLSETEIAARLGISAQRIRTAIEVFSDIPKEYHSKIKHKTSGRHKKGTISAGVAAQVINIKSRHHLSHEQVKPLLDFAAKDGTSSVQLSKIAPLLKSGLSVDRAIKGIEDFKFLAVGVLMNRKTIDRLEKKYDQRISEILHDHLAENEEFDIVRRTLGKKPA